MRPFVTGCAVALALITSVPPAHADCIGIYNDSQGSSSCMTVTPFVLVNTYVIHSFTPGATGSRWKVENNSVMTNLGWTAGGIIIGDPYTDFTAGYGGCAAGPIVILSLQHMWFGQAMTCGEMRVVAAPGYPAPLVSDCNAVDKWASGGRFFFNPGPGCDGYCIVPVEPATWGRVKSLYR